MITNTDILKWLGEAKIEILDEYGSRTNIKQAGIILTDNVKSTVEQTLPQSDIKISNELKETAKEEPGILVAVFFADDMEYWVKFHQDPRPIGEGRSLETIRDALDYYEEWEEFSIPYDEVRW